jgi:hypothetical protein
MRRVTKGLYRTEASEHRPARAYVIDAGKAYFLIEADYRTKKLEPAYEDLPTEDEYHA